MYKRLSFLTDLMSSFRRFWNWHLVSLNFMFCIIFIIPSSKVFSSSIAGGQFSVLKPNVSFTAVCSGFKKWNAFHLILHKNSSVFSISYLVYCFSDATGMFFVEQLKDMRSMFGSSARPCSTI